MAKMMIIGDTLVNELEFQNKEDQFKELIASAVSENHSDLTLEVSNGVIEASSLQNQLAPPDPITGAEVPYQTISTIPTTLLFVVALQ